MQNIQKYIIHKGDALHLLEDFPKESIDLVITSPPYADKRGKNYNTITEKYVYFINNDKMKRTNKEKIHSEEFILVSPDKLFA